MSIQKILSFFLCVTICSLLVHSGANAAPDVARAVIPGAANPIRTGDEFAPVPTAQSTLNAPRAVIEGQSSGAAPQDSGPSFLLNRVTFEGLSFFREEEFAPFTTCYLNREVRLSDLNQMAKDITAYLRKRGYILSQAVIPAQSIRNGEVKVQIIEGYIDQVELQYTKGALCGNECFIRQMLDKITLERPLCNKTLERYLLLVDDLGGISIRTVVKPSKTNPGAATLVAVIDQELVDGQLTYDNYGSGFIGWDRLYGRVSLNAIDQNFQKLTIQGATVPSNVKELEQLQIQYDEPIGSEGFDAYVVGLISDSKPGETLNTILLDGDNLFLTVGGRYPIIRARGENFNVGGLFDIKNSKSNAFNTLLNNDHLRVLRAYGSYDWADTWQGVNLIYAAISQGVPILGASKSNSVTISRIGGDVNFTKGNITLQRAQQIWGPFSANITMDGQITGDELLSAEQIGFGGNYYGRGYNASEIVGDLGFGTEVQLIARLSDQEDTFYRNPQLYLFYDLGTVRNNGNTFGLDKSQTITSGGVGLRSYIFSSSIYFDVVLARQLSRDTFVNANEATKGQFSVGVQF